MRLRWPAIVFDLDGTLIDTIPLIVASHQHALSTVLGIEVPVETLRAGLGTPLMEQMVGFDRERAQDLYDTYRRWNHANTAALLGTFPGVDDLLIALAGDRARLGIATSKSRDAVDLAFRVQPLSVPFDAIVTIEDTTIHKPHGEPVLLAIDRLGATPDRAVYVGDATHDLQAARAAGCAAVAVTWGAATSTQLAAESPDAIATTPAQLLTILREWR